MAAALNARRIGLDQKQSAKMYPASSGESAEKTATNLNQAIESTITVARNEWKYVAEVVTDFDDPFL